MIRPFEPTASLPPLNRTSLREALPVEQKLPELSKDEQSVIKDSFSTNNVYTQYTSGGNEQTQVIAKGRVLDIKG
jgi:hypothetical protein